MIVDIDPALAPEGCMAAVVANHVRVESNDVGNVEATLVCGARSVTLRKHCPNRDDLVPKDFSADCAIALGAMCIGCPNNASESIVAPPPAV